MMTGGGGVVAMMTGGDVVGALLAAPAFFETVYALVFAIMALRVSS